VTNAPLPRLVLASQSPRRQTLLRDAGYEFETVPADVDEENYPPGTLPSDLAIRLATAKANAVAEKFPDRIVLAADTVVALGDLIIGKPRDADDARRILRLLAGTTQIVITGVAVIAISDTFARSARVMSSVRMRDLSGQEIEHYIATGEWEGKAGAYGIQDRDPFVTRMTGCHTNIVGLPMTTTAELLKAAGIQPTNRANA
jgi:septum formation protein